MKFSLLEKGFTVCKEDLQVCFIVIRLSKELGGSTVTQPYGCFSCGQAAAVLPGGHKYSVSSEGQPVMSLGSQRVPQIFTVQSGCLFEAAEKDCASH